MGVPVGACAVYMSSSVCERRFCKRACVRARVCSVYASVCVFVNITTQYPITQQGPTFAFQLQGIFLPGGAARNGAGLRVRVRAWGVEESQNDQCGTVLLPAI